MASFLVVTSISAPNHALRELARGGLPFILIGDSASPAEFDLPGCDFYSLARQRSTELRTALVTRERHYARKNIGYLLGMRQGADVIIETDDDNIPRQDFWIPRQRMQRVEYSEGQGWVNAYNWFTEAAIWPRGFPLDAPRSIGKVRADRAADCPIQQGLADDNPDVDAIYRLVLPLPVKFRTDRRIALGQGSWCPFNSQNTTWFRDAFPLLYLPSTCSFRMTDIWRSFVAQRIAWANGWSVLFHEPTVYQERNEHDLMRDFADEVPGYLHNRRIAEILERAPVAEGVDQIGDNLRLCYEALVAAGLLAEEELLLLDAWINDYSDSGIGSGRKS